MKTTPQTVQATPKKKGYQLWSFFDPTKQSHRHILSLCIQYGWSKEHKVTGKEVADLGRRDKWLRGLPRSGQSPVKKPLMDMEKKEISKVIVALENMVSGNFVDDF